MMYTIGNDGCVLPTYDDNENRRHWLLYKLNYSVLTFSNNLEDETVGYQCFLFFFNNYALQAQCKNDKDFIYFTTM